MTPPRGPGSVGRTPLNPFEDLRMKTSALVVALTTLASPAAAQVSLYDIRGQGGDQFGRAVAGIGDLDGDGVRDLLVGSPYDDGPLGNEGAIVLISGATGQGFQAVFGHASGDAFGFAVEAIGDVDGDGTEDFAVGAPYADVGNWADAGEAYVYSGATFAELLVVQGFQVDGHLGWDVAAFGGDVGGTSAPDWAVSHPGITSSTGGVTFIDGAVGPQFGLIGVQSGGLYGYSIDGVGDTNQNGVLELLVGAPTVSTNGWSNNGVASLVEFGTTLAIKGGIGNSTGLGTTVAGLGDTNGDGTPDFAFGEAYSNAGGPDSGEVHVYSGADHAELWSVAGEPSSSLGLALDGAGDVNGDGFMDVIAGAPFSDLAGFDHGRVDVFSGLDGSTLMTQFGYQGDDEMGRAVAGVGDLNGDGFDDVACCAPFSDGNGVNSGWTHFTLSNLTPPSSYCVAKQNSAGCTPTLGYVGCPSYSISNYFHMQAYNVLPNKPGLLIWAFEQAAIPFFGGTLCLQPPIKRGPVQISADLGTGACGGLYSAPFVHADMVAAGMTPGTSFNAQFWSRDPGFAAPNNVGLTQGLHVEILP